ncbi:chain-length determining protein [Ramlibacter sp.]|uniref:chain-length determining protein n=1 Tax=Ramlibacter sp. TaxID=1917967 RepID=UPI002FCADA84
MSFLHRLPSWQRSPVLWPAAVFVVLSTIYWLLIAADRYVSEARVVLERSELSGGQTMDFASMIGSATGGHRPDQLLLRDHLRSVDMLKKLEAKLKLRDHYATHGDWLSRLWDTDAPIESLHEYFQSRVNIELDEFSGVLVIGAQAYTPEMARDISAALLAEGERHMNGLGHQLAREQLRFLEQQAEQLGQRVLDSRSAVLAYQNRKGMVSPQATAENIAAIVARLEGQLAELQTRRTGLLSFLQPTAPQVSEVNAQIAAIETQLKQERARLAAPQGATLNKTVEEFQRLQLEAEFAQQMLNTALVALERGRVDATRTLKQVQVLQSANLPEHPLRPRRFYNALVYALAALLIAGVLQLLLAIVRDHKD